MNWSEMSQGQPLRWVQPRKFKMNYELVHGNEVISTLRFKSSWGSLATAENADGCWEFKRVGFSQTRVIIRACGSEAEIATFRMNPWKGGGTLELPTGHQIRAKTNLCMTQLEFREESGESLIRIKYDSFWCTSATLDMHQAALTEDQTSWIVPLAWYLMVAMQTDAGSCVGFVPMAAT